MAGPPGEKLPNTIIHAAALIGARLISPTTGKAAATTTMGEAVCLTLSASYRLEG